jgi:hypothetical protein
MAFTSYYRPDGITETDLLEVVLREDGAMALTCGRGTDTYTNTSGMPERVVFPVLVLGLTHCLLSMAAHLAANVSGYQGRWAVGVMLDNLKGVGPWDGRVTWGDMGVAYSRADYEQLTTTITTELVENPSAVVERLLGRLMRGLGVERRYLPYSAESLGKSPT